MERNEKRFYTPLCSPRIHHHLALCVFVLSEPSRNLYRYTQRGQADTPLRRYKALPCAMHLLSSSATASISTFQKLSWDSACGVLALSCLKPVQDQFMSFMTCIPSSRIRVYPKLSKSNTSKTLLFLKKIDERHMSFEFFRKSTRIWKRIF
jgi:hypothetical protein